jgi:hypothetical protein
MIRHSPFILHLGALSKAFAGAAARGDQTTYWALKAELLAIFFRGVANATLGTAPLPALLRRIQNASCWALLTLTPT